jgi:NAD(P)-dependent dehydrogenase (short-subunit alcohol dehydrogenase family)
MTRFDGKSVLVTGGTGALGSAVVQAFLMEGASVTVTYRAESPLDALRERVGDLRTRLDAVRADVTDEYEVHEAVSMTVARHGGIDALVNVVGGYFGGVPVERLSTDDWNRMHDLNLRSAFYLSRAVVPCMRARKSGRIVNVGSRAGLRGVATLSAYSVAKGGVVLLTEALAEELKDDGITVNCILPSVMDTPANRVAMPKADASRWATPDDVARVVLFLASDDARVVSGATIPVYGRA